LPGFILKMKKIYLILLAIIISIRPTFIVSFFKKIFNFKRKIISTKEGYFFIDALSNFGYNLISKGFYEKNILSSLKNLLSAGDTFVDLGANEGYFSIVSSKLVGESGIVVSIEPQSRLINVILKNKNLNNLKNIFVEKVAISNYNSIRNLYLSPNTNSGSSRLYLKQKYSNHIEYVKTKTLLYIIKKYQLSRIKILKIDIEGFEYEAILGSKELFLNNVIENIIIEMHPKLLLKRDKSEKDIIQFLEKCGYQNNQLFNVNGRDNKLLFNKI